MHEEGIQLISSNAHGDQPDNATRTVASDDPYDRIMAFYTVVEVILSKREHGQDKDGAF